MLTRDQILSQTQLPMEAVQAFGGKVFVRTMSGTDRDSFEQDFLDAKTGGQKPNIRGALAARTVCDEQGNRLFTDADAEALGQLSARDLDKVFTVASKLNGIGKDDISELEKN